MSPDYARLLLDLADMIDTSTMTAPQRACIERIRAELIMMAAGVTTLLTPSVNVGVN